MLRFRRYRVFVICAVIITILLFHVSRNSQWDPVQPPFRVSTTKLGASAPQKPPPASPGSNGGKPVSGPLPSKSSSNEKAPVSPSKGKDKDKDIKVVKIPELKPDKAGTGDYAVPTAPRASSPTKAKGGKGKEIGAGGTKPTKAAGASIPDRLPGPVEDLYQPADESEVHIGSRPGKHQDPVLPAPTTIHWQKPTERFPVPEQSLILLPTGKPMPIPQIQAVFGKESEAAKNKREARLVKVKAEAVRAWTGYKTYAWTHDELRPVSNKSKDPFCGWAATMVDALDTLWIMGLYDEFDDAAKAVEDIDFTTTPYRSDIPVFETVIRYLGGLLAAYDISGGHQGNYRVFLNKAIELAEILMGVFDTPNRMPILYYNWKPTFSSNPQRASTSSSVAELGSMSMEFTRLAQLTGKNKYYDAIARITDAFEELQNAGTAIPGLFPKNIDASGCNRTATDLWKAEQLSKSAKMQTESATDLAEEPVGYVVPETAGSSRNSVHKDGKSYLEFKVVPGDSRGEHATGEFHKLPKREVDEDLAAKLKDFPPVDGAIKKHPPNNTYQTQSTGNTGGYLKPNADVKAKAVVEAETAAPEPSPPFSASGLTASWECIPQGLTSGGYGWDDFSMGGSQDSTYEYFPKQYLLLGGLEPKYATINEKVIKAVKKYLLYRPMVDDNDRDILFSAKALSRDNTDQDLTYEWEVTHLTCFLGGMFAMSGKVFGVPEDVELGKKLADGCVWAYEAFPSGIMPEYAQVLPCVDTENCRWNATRWHQRLDPNWENRDVEMQDYKLRKAAWDEQMVELKKEEERRRRLLAESKLAKERQQRLADEAGAQSDETSSASSTSSSSSGSKSGSGPVTGPGVFVDDAAPKLKEKKDTTPGSLRKRQDIVGPRAPSQEKKQQSSGTGTSSPEKKQQPSKPETASSQVKKQGTTPVTKEPPPNEVKNQRIEKEIDDKVTKLEAELDLNSSSDHEQFESFSEQEQKPLPPLVYPIEPNRPKTHEEYVQDRLVSEHLVPGFVMLNDRRYILRPEAIESVWYMYRITGDPIWQDKGWRMFEAIIAATQTGAGHSAINDVAFPGKMIKQDSMESFWLAETLKYFYLLFETPDVISLDEWVLNTEAHPFKRPT